MAKKKRFSMFNDPSFSNFTDKDWEEWKKNADKIPDGTPPFVCEKCLLCTKDDTCEILTLSQQQAHINLGECDDRIE